MQSSQAQTLPPCDVLVIDDEPAVRMSIQRVLESRCNVRGEPSVSSGIAYIKRRCPDIILLDIRIPDIDGIKGLCMIREIEPDVPIIMLTAYASPGTMRQAMRYGANDYLTKPFDIDEIHDAIAHNLIPPGSKSRWKRARPAASSEVHLPPDILRDSEASHNTGLEFIHDLSNHMTVVSSYVQMACEMWPEIASSSGTLAERQLGAYLDMSRQQSAAACEILESYRGFLMSSETPFEHLNMSSVVEEAASLARMRSGIKGSVIEFDTVLEECIVRGNRRELVRAFHNIHINAIDAAPPGGGTVGLHCGPQGSDAVVVLSNPFDPIPSDLQRRIFKPFVTTKPTGQGTGLGLFIAKKIITHHSGEIVVESTLEPQVTEFTVRIPLAGGRPRRVSEVSQS